MVEEVESLQRPCPEKRLPILPSQQFSAGSRVEAMAHQETGPVSPAELAQWDEIDQA